MVFGDSISAGYGIAQGAGWVNLLGKRIDQQAPDYKVVNASLSGETAAGGKRRIAAALDQHRPAIVIVELGGNDGLRGTPPETIEADLDAIVSTSLKRNARVLLVGMQLPPNYGAPYIQRFREIYPRIAKKHAVALAPFMFEGFGERQEMFQPDGIHPTREAQTLMLETVWRALAPLVKQPTPAPARR